MRRSAPSLVLPSLTKKPVAVDWNGGELSSDAGVLLLAQADRALGFCRRFAACLTDRRDPLKVRHTLLDLIRQRIYQIALGYKDANDAQSLRVDPLLKMAVDRLPSSGRLAGQSTLCRLENSVTEDENTKLELFLIDSFLDRCDPEARRVVIDLDPYDDPCHGEQQGSLFNGYYECCCYLPLMCVGSVDRSPQRLVGVMLRGGTAQATDEAPEFMELLVSRIRERWPGVEIILRGDAGFGKPVLIEKCRKLGIYYCFGLGTNERLKRLVRALEQRVKAAAKLREKHKRLAGCTRMFGETQYAAESWVESERVIMKSEATLGAVHSRFLVTNLTGPDWAPCKVHRFYSERGDRENRIKEFKLDMAGDRLSCNSMVANQFRLAMHAAAYILCQHIQEQIHRINAHSPKAHLQAGTLREQLFKVAARVIERVRVVRVHLCSSYPDKSLWTGVLQRLTPAPT